MPKKTTEKLYFTLGLSYPPQTLLFFLECLSMLSSFPDESLTWGLYNCQWHFELAGKKTN